MRRRFCAAALAVLLASPAWAIDYLSVGSTGAIYDAPSGKSAPLRVIARGTPVEQVVVVGAWVKVRDPRGTLGWMEKGLLAEQRTVMVRASRAQIRSQPNDSASLVFEAEPEVVLDLLEVAPGGWAKVRHIDGQSGYVRATQVWGL